MWWGRSCEVSDSQVPATAPRETAGAGKEIGLEPQTVIDIMQESFKASLFLAMPALLAALITGVAVSIFQAVTSIQEQTLALVPKMLAVLITLTIGFSWMLSSVSSGAHSTTP